MKLRNNQSGFTLIELLVVISIVSFIANTLLYSVTVARVKARDAKRKQDFRIMRDALALYYDANNETYPYCGNSWTYSSDEDWNKGSCLSTALAPYLARLPVDPLANGSPWIDGSYNYAYQATVDEKDYDLVSQLEILDDTETCQFKSWLWRTGNGESWCNKEAGNGFSPQLYADH